MTLEPLTAAVVVLAALMALMLAAGAGLYRRVRELELATYHGVGLTLTAGRNPGQLPDLNVDGRRSIILKINRRCPVCDDLLAEAARIAPALDTGTQVVVLSDDPDFDRDLPGQIRVIKDPAAWRAVSTPYVPALVVVDERGTVLQTAPGGSGAALETVIDQFSLRRKEAGR